MLYTTFICVETEENKERKTGLCVFGNQRH